MFYKHDYLKTSIIVLAVMVLALAALPSFAASMGSSPLPANQPLQQVRDFFTGTFAWTVSIVSLVVSGSMLAFGADFNGTAKTFLLLAIVLSFIVFANNFLSTMFAGAVIPL